MKKYNVQKVQTTVNVFSFVLATTLTRKKLNIYECDNKNSKTKSNEQR